MGGYSGNVDENSFHFSCQQTTELKKLVFLGYHFSEW